MDNVKNNSKIILITGTDTGVGKTWVGCAIARLLRASGCSVIALKPVETGCAGSLVEDEDGVALANAAGQMEPLHAFMRFHDPVAPPVAADREGRRIDFKALVHWVLGYANGFDFALVEGAGGLFSPITWDKNAVDLAQELGASAVLVTSDRLGTINHTLMALKFLVLNHIDVLGVVLSAPEKTDASTGSNAAAISRILGCDRIFSAPRTHDTAIIVDSLQEVIQWIIRSKGFFPHKK